MLHAFVESLPFSAGILLGLATYPFLVSSVLRPWVVSLGSIAVGLTVSFMVGELAGDPTTVITAVCLDSVAAFVGWAGSQFLLARWRTAH